MGKGRYWGRKVPKVLLAGALTISMFMNTGEVSAASGVNIQTDSTSLVEKKKAIQKKILQKDDEIRENQKEMDSVLEQLTKIGKDITEMEESAGALEGEIEATIISIRQLQEDIVKLEDTLEKRDLVLQSRMRSLQTSGGPVTYIDVLLSSDSFGDFIDRYSSVRTLVEADRRLMVEQSRDRDNVKLTQVAVYKQFDDLKVKRDDLTAKLKEVVATKKEKETLVDDLEKLQAKNIDEIMLLESDYIEVLLEEGNLEQAIIDGQMITYSETMGELAGKYCNPTGTLNEESFHGRLAEAGALSGKGDAILAVSVKYNLDPVLVAAIILHETGNGTSNAVKLYNNPGGLMNPDTNWMGLTRFETLDAGIDSMGRTLKRIIHKEGNKTIQQIGAVYAPVGVANDPNGLNQHWKGNVTKIVTELGGLTGECNTNDMLMAKGKWISPAKGTKSSNFGWRMHPIDKVLKQHRGIDIANVIGTPVYAAGGGVVTEARNLSGYGNAIMITHVVDGEVLTTVYGHLDSIGVRKGDRVDGGQEIGKMGNTGNSTGPHLHFEMHEGTYTASGPSAVNPLRYVSY